MPTQKEIVFLLSGGSSNSDPRSSIGGGPSTTAIADGLNNLYDDVTRSEAQAGIVDYRCFYIKNASFEDWTDLKIFVRSQTTGGSFVTIGVSLADDKQQFNVISDNGITGGSFRVKFENSSMSLFALGETTFDVAYAPDIDDWANNFKAGLVSAGFSSDIVVTGAHYGNLSNPVYNNKQFDIFTIDFIGHDGKRNQPLLVPHTNSLTPIDTSILTSAKIINGSPSNSVAQQMPNDKTVPKGVIFQPTTAGAPFEVGTLRAGEVLPIWTERSVAANVREMENDDFVIGFRGTSIVY